MGLDGWRAENPKAFTVKGEPWWSTRTRNLFCRERRSEKWDDFEFEAMGATRGEQWCLLPYQVSRIRLARCWLRVPSQRHPRRQHQDLLVYGIVNNNMPHVDGDGSRRIRVAGQHIQTNITTNCHRLVGAKIARKQGFPPAPLPSKPTTRRALSNTPSARHLDPKEMTRAEARYEAQHAKHSEKNVEPNGPRPLVSCATGTP